MAGFSPHPRAVARRPSWPQELHRASILLGVGSILYWSSFVIGPTMWWLPSFGGAIYVDLLLAWIAVLVQVAAWPSLWGGLRDLLARHPKETSPTLAWRAFLLTLLLSLTAAAFLPIEYHTVASSEAWLLVLYVSAFPFLAWTSIPVLALHGIVFGRVANYLDGRPRFVADLGAFLLFAVAAASTAVIIQYPEPSAFVRSWSVGRGLLPAAAFIGYGLIAVGMTLHAAPVVYRARTRAIHEVR